MRRQKSRNPICWTSFFPELQKAIIEDNIDSLKRLNRAIEGASGTRDQVNLQEYCDDPLIKSTNLIILACKHSRVKCLEYLLGDDCKILSNLSVKGTDISPGDVDDAGHNAFYYAIRSGSVDLLDTLISKWPNSYFISHFDELDQILSAAYEELKLKNVVLPSCMEIFVENKLINLRFFSNASSQDQTPKSLHHIGERIELIVDNIELLKSAYGAKTVDAKFLFIVKFVAQNLHILKRQLKSTYDRLPWEEIEFCLVIFVVSQTQRQEMNLFYQATLRKNKILKYLTDFGKRLEGEKDIVERVNINKIADLPKLRREKVVVGIMSSSPEFEELYNDYQQIRDIYSLQKITNYVELAVSIDPTEREGQIIIMRVLQVIGEYFKNTLESPKLSNTTSELLLVLLSKSTRKAVVHLRNSSSHAYSLSKRIEIEEHQDTEFFLDVQKDMKKIGNVIAELLYYNKLKIIRSLLKKIIDSESLDEVRETIDVLRNVEFNITMSENFKLMEHEKLEQFVAELSDSITDKTMCEEKRLSRMSNIISCTKTKTEHDRSDYFIGFSMLNSWRTLPTDNRFDEDILRTLKFTVKKALECIAPRIKCSSLKQIAQLSIMLYRSVSPRLQEDVLIKVHRLNCEIIKICEFGMVSVRWIEELHEKLNVKGPFVVTFKQKKSQGLPEEKYRKQLTSKLSELKAILKDNALSSQTVERCSLYKNNRGLRAAVEMLVLDIISILSGWKNNFENNFLFLDDHAPLLIGKCLRDHLAHDNDLVDVLFDASTAVMLNAMAIAEKDIIKSKKKIGKLVDNDPVKLKEKLDTKLDILDNQIKMFAALEEGNLDEVKNYLRMGADIKAKNIDSSTALHFAAKGPSLETVQFILSQTSDAEVRDIRGRSPLHIAAAHGRKNIVKFLLKETTLDVDSVDETTKTPLHNAVQSGHKDVVEVLLENNADTDVKDAAGNTALYYALLNDHFEVVKVLLDREINVNFNVSNGGFTPLHIAAASGRLELVDFLLKRGANVDARNAREEVPLHTAALNGHLEAVKLLLSKGADVNAKFLDGCTSLHFAVKTGRQEVAEVLLKAGAAVDACDETFDSTPLHCAAKNGYEGIVKLLLRYNADLRAVTVKGATPLHLAALSGHLKIVSTFLKRGASIHTKDKNDITALHVAAANGHTAVAELLIRSGAEVDARVKNSFTPLHLAALNGRQDMIDLLLRNHAEVNARDITGNTPLYTATTEGNVDIIELLIKGNADVDAKNNSGITPLHTAATHGNVDAITRLVDHGADVNTKDNYHFTALHSAAMVDHRDVMKFLIKHGADVNAKSLGEWTPLHMAVEAGHKSAVEVLLANGASAKSRDQNNRTPLTLAVKHNSKDIVEILIASGADADDNLPLSMAVYSGYKDIVQILLRNRASINVKTSDGSTLLHMAAMKGHKEIVNTLIRRGVNINGRGINNATPLYLASEGGHDEIVEILLTNGAKINVKCDDGVTPLHIAAIRGYSRVVKILLNHKADINVKDKKNRTALELAVAHTHLEVVKLIIQCKKVDIHAKGSNSWSLLHIASGEENNLEIVKYLTSKGCDINARNSFGSKPIHMAAREGFKDTVEFFLSKGIDVNDPGAGNQTLLHSAAIHGHVDVVTFLIARGANVNAKDIYGVTPMHAAANSGHRDVIEVLLKNGAFYDALNTAYIKPLQMAVDKKVINLLTSTEKLLEAVKSSNPPEVKNCIKSGACIDARNSNSMTSLHYAAWKGYDEIVYILLQNKANPNVVGSKGSTPLHYAAKFSHLRIVMILLSHGAIYEAPSESTKTPLYVAADAAIINVLKLVAKAFEQVKNNNPQVVSDLNKIENIEVLKAVMNARDSENRTLIVAAVHSNFCKVQELKEIFQDDVSLQIDTALTLATKDNYRKALTILRSAYAKRVKILGLDNPGSLDIQRDIAKVLYKQGVYREALNVLEEILQKQTKILGANDKDTLKTRSVIALIFHRQGRDDEALNIYQEVCQIQKNTLGPYHLDTLDSLFHVALVLDRKRKHEEALNINRIVFEKRKDILGEYHPLTIAAQNNTAMVLANQDKCDEALAIYRDVYEKKKLIMGVQADTVRTLHHIALILLKQRKFNEALCAHEEVYNIQKNLLGENHPDTINTQYNVANVLLAQGKFISALKVYWDSYNRMNAVYGSFHPIVLDISKKLKMINCRLKLEGSNPLEILQHLQNNVNTAASNGNVWVVQFLLKSGVDANEKDSDGRTPLHYAVRSGKMDVIKVLLNNGADVTRVTNKGNTTLHTAASTGNKDIVEVLLQHTNHDKLSDFINAKTHSGGTTALHMAAKNGSLEVVKSLLKHGATYDVENTETQTPADLSNDDEVTSLFKFIEELFNNAKNGDLAVVNKLKAVKTDEFAAITNARNSQGITLPQVALVNKHKSIASKLLKMLKEPN